MIDRFNLWAGELYCRIRSLKAREDGQALVEYGLILALVSVVAFLALQAIGVNVTAKLQAVADDI
jgi:pilus assembly protein Flp/PilA